MSKGQRFFGHQVLAEQLSHRLQQHFLKDSQADSSLVIGVFGEWGSGKSNLLQLINEEFKLPENADLVDLEQPPILVVPFNPWRYEKEAHLLIPLLKNMQLVIEQYSRDHEEIWDKLKLQQRLKQSARFVGVSALAFLQSFKAKYKPTPESEIEFDPKIFIKGATDAATQKDSPKSALESLESYYFEFEQNLSAYTTGNQAFRLLFLIDDLDRCLPEKAVEMLESVKLFLDVEGCAFVLALDDEVVERGIVHRYRDYIFQNHGQANKEQKNLSQLPITGPEYLEKIIHLPFRLPQPSRSEMRRFLINRYPSLFVDESTQLSAEAGDKQSQRDTHSTTQNSKLLNLFVSQIPPVPRKQIRTAELLLLLLNMAKARGCEHQVNALPLAKLTLLQLFAPDLYRFGRRRFMGFMQILQEWASQHNNWGQHDFAKKLEKQIKSPKGGEDELTENQQIEARNFDHFYQPLLQALDEAAHSRSGFDPYQLIKNQPLSKEELQDLPLYFSFVDEARLQEEENQAAILEQESQTLQVAELANIDAFLDLLFSDSQGSWQSAMMMPELQGRVLDDKTFDAISQRLKQTSFRTLLTNLDWLKWVSPHLNTQQFMQLADQADNFVQILPASLPKSPTDEQVESYFPSAKWLASLRPTQQQVLAKQTTAVRVGLADVLKKHRLAVKPRAKAGRILAEFGDSRKGVGVQTLKNVASGIPDIAWQEIPAGTLHMGLAKDENKTSWDAHSKPQHDVNLSRYFISRYPITNAQYACFVDAEVYDDTDFWQEKLPQAASLWRQDGKSDEKLLDMLTDKSIQKVYRRRLKGDKARHQPRYWSDEKWNVANHPVVGVSWFEALAYSVWLNENIHALKPEKLGNKAQVYLPSEAEWEYAARGDKGLTYAWGEKSDAKLGNFHATDLERTSAVGLFSSGKAFGVYDMSGNVWEWTMSRWGETLNEPSFSYKKWQAQESQRDLPESLDARIIRGGSWFNTTDIVRCAFRSGIILAIGSAS